MKTRIDEIIEEIDRFSSEYFVLATVNGKTKYANELSFGVDNESASNFFDLEQEFTRLKADELSENKYRLQ